MSGHGWSVITVIESLEEAMDDRLSDKAVGIHHPYPKSFVRKIRDENAMDEVFEPPAFIGLFKDDPKLAAMAKFMVRVVGDYDIEIIKQQILDEAYDAACDFLHHREAVDLIPPGAIESAIKLGIISIDEILAVFRRALEDD